MVFIVEEATSIYSWNLVVLRDIDWSTTAMVPMMWAWMNSPTKRAIERRIAWAEVTGSISSPSRMFTEKYREKMYC
jgi:hypothetical protein